MSSTGGKIEMSIRNKLHKALEATHLEIINESHLHNAPAGAETHFRVLVVSKKFEGLSSLKRHRLVNDSLREEIRTGVRALSIVAQTPQQRAGSERAGDPAAERHVSFGVSPSRRNNAEVARWP